MDLNLIIEFVGLVFGLISVIFGIGVTKRVSGKLKTSVAFLVLATFGFVLVEIIKILGFLTVANLDILKNIALLAAIFFIFIATMNLRHMIDGIDGKYKKY